MDWTQGPDLMAAALVLGGTLAAALLRCGWCSAREALRSMHGLLRPPFASSQIKAELAAQIGRISEDGLHRAEPHQLGDGEFSAVADALIRHRSIAALHEEHEKHRCLRLASAETAVQVLSDAAELAPVLGLAGTLLSLVGLPSAADGADYGPAIGTAVATTLYGLILANFVLAPLAAAVRRRSGAEEKARQELLDWLAQALTRTITSLPAVPATSAAE